MKDEEYVATQSKIRDLLLNPPPGEMDDSMVEMVRGWSLPPKSVEILYTLDMAVHGSLCSDAVVMLLDRLLRVTMKFDEIGEEELLALATWRTQG